MKMNRSVGDDLAMVFKATCDEIVALRAERDALLVERNVLAELLEDVVEVCSHQEDPWDSPEWVAASVKLAALAASARTKVNDESQSCS